jgi:NDP-sugar pyrophosphorylase family protein
MALIRSVVSVNVESVDPTFEELGSRIEPVRGLIRGEWHRHQNPDGSTGGWVQNTASVQSTCSVGPNALVVDFALVKDSAQILNSAYVGGWSVVSGHAIVSEHAKVTDTARVGGNCHLKGNVVVRGSVALLSGTFWEGVVRRWRQPRISGPHISGSRSPSVSKNRK